MPKFRRSDQKEVKSNLFFTWALKYRQVLVIVLTALVFGTVLIREQQQALEQARIDGFPGLKDQISERSKRNLETSFKKNPNVIGGWISKVNFEQFENPTVYYVAKHPIIETHMKNLEQRQRTGQGRSSAELMRDPSLTLRNSPEAREGRIQCVSLTSAGTTTAQLTPEILKYAKSICRATIPPFTENPNLGIVVLINIDDSVNTPELQAVRRMLLQLQIDIFNRDYQGYETWASDEFYIN